MSHPEKSQKLDSPTLLKPSHHYPQGISKGNLEIRASILSIATKLDTPIRQLPPKSKNQANPAHKPISMDYFLPDNAASHPTRPKFNQLIDPLIHQYRIFTSAFNIT